MVLYLLLLLYSSASVVDVDVVVDAAFAEVLLTFVAYAYIVSIASF